MSCNVCYESFNNSTHKLVNCPKGCGYKCCKQCIRTYFKDILNEPHCMNCKVEWESEFIITSLNKSYYNNDFKESRKITLMNIEKSRLPDTQADAKQFILEEEFNTQTNLVKVEIKKLKEQILIKESEIVLIHAQFLQTKKKKDGKKVFIMKCQSTTCNGYLSTSYKCELCNKHTCAKCFDIIENVENVQAAENGHVCKPENVESVTLMKKETRACPGCAVRIYKIDGCDQMWCVECNTAFDWVSGKIVNGAIHNPHYYDYLQKKGNVPRAPGDVLCGGLPLVQHMLQRLAILNTPVNNKKENIVRNLANIHQFVNHIHHEYMTLLNNTYYQTNLTTLRIKFILNRMPEDTFKQNIYKEYNKNLKTQKKKQLLQMVDNVGTDLLQTFNQILEQRHTIDNIYVKMHEMIYAFCEIINYYNNLVEKHMKLFGGTINTIEVLVNSKQMTKELTDTDVVKYRY